MLHNPLGLNEQFQGKSQWGEYGDSIAELDHNVGHIFDSLKDHGTNDNTIVVYASDNGRGPGRVPDPKIRVHPAAACAGGFQGMTPGSNEIGA